VSRGRGVDQPRRLRAQCAAMVAALALSIGCRMAWAGAALSAAVPAEVALGERLFLETRFSQPYFARQQTFPDRAGATPPTGPAAAPAIPGEVSCRSCHLVDELRNAHGGGVRAYTDFASRSPIPARADGATTTVRNSPTMVDATRPRAVPMLLHYDGEFASREDLVRATLTGRNLGWEPAEHEIAVAHLAQVIRTDDGEGALARQYGGIPYRVMLDGRAAGIPPRFRLPLKFRLNCAAAADRQVLDAVARLIAAYMDSLRFSTDAAGRHSGSPYDVFLARNRMPQAPAPGESDRAYGRRLRVLLDALVAPRYVSNLDGRFRFHAQDFQFGPAELAGLKIFLTESGAHNRPVGNCVSCHAAPHFSDFRFHNTGVSQFEYDAIHGSAAFERLAIPSLAQRNAAPERYLPPSPEHPRASGRFRSAPDADRPGFTDLGVWNVLDNPDLPAPQQPLRAILCGEFAQVAAPCSASALLPLTVGLFKTPSLRDLGQTGPYLHNGSLATIEGVLHFYLRAAGLAQGGRLRNADPELSRIKLGEADLAALAAFLRALNEDYQEVRGARNLAARNLLWWDGARSPYGPIAGLAGFQVQVTKVSTSAAAVAQLRGGKFAWVVFDARGAADPDNAALRQAVRSLRDTHVEIPIIVLGDAQSAPRLHQDAAHFGLTIAVSPGALLSDLIAVRGDD